MAKERKPTKLALAWAAGVIDGEGCLHISNSRPDTKARGVNRTYSLYLKVTMGHRPTIKRLVAIFGVGSIQSVTQWRYNPAYSWLVTSHRAISVIRLVRPYLVTKAVEADIAERFMAIPRAPRGGNGGSVRVPTRLLARRHALWDKMRRAKPSFRFREERGKILGDRVAPLQAPTYIGKHNEGKPQW